MLQTQHGHVRGDVGGGEAAVAAQGFDQFPVPVPAFTVAGFRCGVGEDVCRR